MVILSALTSKTMLTGDLVHDVILYTVIIQITIVIIISIPVRFHVNNMAPFSLSALCVFPFKPLCHPQCPLLHLQSERWKANEQ